MKTISKLARRKSVRIRVWKTLNVIVGVVTILNLSLIGALVPRAAWAANPAAELQQCRNGGVGDPTQDCEEVGGPLGWEHGNAGASNSHYVEGESIPYRAVLTNLPTDGTVVTLTLGYDIKHSGKHAVDYLTHYDRTDVSVDPTDGVSGVSGSPTDTATIPAPSSAGSPVSGQPTTSFNALPAGEKVMSLWNGNFDGAITYTSEGDLNASQSETVISVSFVPTDTIAVLSWGGHIGSRLDWGVGNSAGGINGSPYHMRIKDWNLGNLGNEDRSLSANAIVVPATIIVEKQTNPDGDSTPFDFTGDLSGSISDGQTIADTVEPGEYTVTEDLIAGWTLSGISCNDDDSSGDTGTRTATFVVDEGENVTCVFTNDRDAGTVTIHKVVDNQGIGTAQPSDWTFTVDGQQYHDGDQITLPTGTYPISESGPAGYVMTDVSGVCYDDGGTFLNVMTEGGDCTFTNTKLPPPPEPASITVLKNVDENGDGDIDVTGATDWTWDVNGGNQNHATGSTQTVTPGLTTVSEDQQAGFHFTSVACDVNEDPFEVAQGESVTFETFAGGHYTCTFTNTRDTGTVTVNKNFDDTGDGTIDRTNPAGWTWDVTSGSQDNTGGSTLTLVTGSYTVTEDVQAGYSSSWSCANSSSGSGTSIAVTVTTGQAQVCTFTNTKNITTIAIDKTGASTVTAGNDITYTLAWSVNGNTPATNAVVTDPLPTNTTFVSAGCGTTTGTCTIDSSTSTISWSLGTRNPGESGTVTMTVKSNTPLANGTVVTNTVTFDTDQTDPVSDTVTTTVSSSPTLSLTKEASPTSTNPLTTVTYTVKWSVAGNANATNVIITDPVPTNVTFVSAADGGVYNSGTNTITWNLGTKAPGSSGHVTWIGQVASTAPAGQITNTASVDSSETDPAITASATINVVLPQVLAAVAPELSITKSVNDDDLLPGNTARYTVVVTNTGDVDATNVVLSDTLPDGFLFVIGGGTSKTWNLGTLTPGQAKTVSYEAVSDLKIKSGTYTNTAVVRADDVNPLSADANVKVRKPKVLGLATTGMGLLDYLIAGLGLAMLGLGVAGLRKLQPRRQKA